MNKNSNDILIEYSKKIRNKIKKVESMTRTPSTNSAKLLLQQANGAINASDLPQARRLYKRAVECLELNVSYI
jgi:hypothetical protein